MNRLVLFLIILFYGHTVIEGQTDPQDFSARLKSLFSRLAVREPDNVKLKVNDSIRILIDDYSLSDTVFIHRFENIRNLGQVISGDSVLKVLSWNIIMSDGISRYCTYFIHRADSGRNRVYSLSGTFSEASIRTDTIYSEKDWYGALIYDIKHIRQDNDEYWLALGINYGNSSITRKVAEVINFMPDNRIIFGRKLFSDGEKLLYRIVLEYSVEAVASLRFVSDSSLVFDHLVPFSPQLSGDRRFYGPDYSYDAYIRENSLWKFARDVDVRNEER
ncbi:MAG: hypothetical protein HPY62_09245 [Bacteroidales bacterium]|nr:hypothetical protein [Bacteroidales bacterium]